MISKGMQLTEIHMDKSSVLESLVADYFTNSWDDLLGEMQLSFLMFMLLYSYPGIPFLVDIFLNIVSFLVDIYFICLLIYFCTNQHWNIGNG